MQARQWGRGARSAARCHRGASLLARRVLEAVLLQLAGRRRRGEGGLAASVRLVVPAPRFGLAALFFLRFAGFGGRGA